MHEKKDNVNHPQHYTRHPSNIECITITQHYNFCIGNAIKYLWRNGLKIEEGLSPVEKQIEDLKKAVWYINQEIRRLRTGLKLTVVSSLLTYFNVDDIVEVTGYTKEGNTIVNYNHVFTPEEIERDFRRIDEREIK